MSDHEAIAMLVRSKDAAYLERNRCVALIARMAIAIGLRAGLARTAIEGWKPEWHGCVYVELPTGQVSWHFHDDHAHLFDGLPAYTPGWDGHETPEKYRRVGAAFRGPIKTPTTLDLGNDETLVVSTSALLSREAAARIEEYLTGKIEQHAMAAVLSGLPDLELHTVRRVPAKS
jgi:hypothetical protein